MGVACSSTAVISRSALARSGKASTARMRRFTSAPLDAVGGADLLPVPLREVVEDDRCGEATFEALHRFRHFATETGLELVEPSSRILAVRRLEDGAHFLGESLAESLRRVG